MLVHCKVTHQHKIHHLYTWVERGNVRVKVVAEQHNPMARTKPALSGDERTNHEVAPPHISYNNCPIYHTLANFKCQMQGQTQRKGTDDRSRILKFWPKYSQLSVISARY